MQKNNTYYNVGALEEEGIFRISGDNTKMQELKKDLNEGTWQNINYFVGVEVDFSKIKNMHNIAGLLKMYFRELPDPLCTYEQYDMFIAAEGKNKTMYNIFLGVPDAQARRQCIKKVIRYLPPANNKLLKILCNFLHKITLNSKLTKMTSANLAIVFAPNLLRPQEENNLKLIFGDSKHANGLMQTLIDEYDYMFEQVKNIYVLIIHIRKRNHQHKLAKSCQQQTRIQQQQRPQQLQLPQHHCQYRQQQQPNHLHYHHAETRFSNLYLLFPQRAILVNSRPNIP